MVAQGGERQCAIDMNNIIGNTDKMCAKIVPRLGFILQFELQFFFIFLFKNDYFFQTKKSIWTLGKYTMCHIEKFAQRVLNMQNLLKTNKSK